MASVNSAGVTIGRAARDGEQPDAERVRDHDHDGRDACARAEHDEEREPVDHDVTFCFGLGLRLIFTARPESATSLTTLSAETSLRRDHRKMPTMTATPTMVSMMMPIDAERGDERRERADDAGRRAG